MNRLKAFPWTQALLALIVMLLVANVIEIHRLNAAIGDVSSHIDQMDSNSMSFTTGLKNSVDNGNDILQRIDQSTSCMENRYQSGCRLTLPLGGIR